MAGRALRCAQCSTRVGLRSLAGTAQSTAAADLNTTWDEPAGGWDEVTPRAPGSPRPTAPSGRRGATTTPTGRRPRPCCCGATAADREPRRVFRGPCSPKPPSRTSPRPCPDGSDLDRQARRWEERPPHVPDAIWLNQVRPVPRAIGGERLRMPPHEGAGRPCRSPGGSSAGTMDVQTPVCLLYI